MSRALVTPASKLPVASYGRWIVLAAGVAAVWGAPALAARMWSSTDWKPSEQLSTIIEAYSNLMHPEDVAGSGLSGGAIWYDYQTIHPDRLTWCVAMAAAANGAVLVERLRELEMRSTTTEAARCRLRARRG